MNKIKYSRNVIVNRLLKQGMEGISKGYTNLSNLKVFQKKIAYGKYGFAQKIGPYETLVFEIELVEIR